MDLAFSAARQSLKSGLQVDTSLATMAAPLVLEGGGCWVVGVGGRWLYDHQHHFGDENVHFSIHGRMGACCGGMV